MLFDQGTPVPLKQELTFDVSTVFELGWATLENGELLTQAEDKAAELRRSLVDESYGAAQELFSCGKNVRTLLEEIHGHTAASVVS